MGIDSLFDKIPPVGSETYTFVFSEDVLKLVKSLQEQNPDLNLGQLVVKGLKIQDLLAKPGVTLLLPEELKDSL